MKYEKTLYRKVQIILFLIILLIFIVALITVSSLVNNTVEETYGNNGLNTVSLLQKNIEVLFNDAYNSLDLIKNQFSDSSSKENRDEIRNFLYLLKETKPYIINAFVAFDDGTYVLEPDVDIREGFDPRQRPWYQKAYQNRYVQWSEPYTDVVTQNIVITGSYYIPFENYGGVVGLDIALEDLPGFLSMHKISDQGYILLVDDQDNIILDSKNQHTNEKLMVIEDDEFLDSQLITGFLKTDKGYYYLRKVVYTDMRLIGFIPESDVRNAAEGVVILSALILLAALLLGLFLARTLLKRITSPIEALTNIIVDNVTSDALIPYDGDSTDEIKALIEGYNRMVVHVNDQREALKSLSTDLMTSEKKLQDQYDKVSEMAYYDYLTLLPNRISFEDKVKASVENKDFFALLYMDLDNFKYINDTYGHHYGDQVLKEIGQRLEKYLKTSTFVARLSGDEFGIMYIYKDLEDLKALSKDILQGIEEPLTINTLTFSMTASIGISLYPQDGKTFERLLSNADIAMYEAKRNLKNQYRVFHPSFRENMIDRLAIESALVAAIEEDEIYLAYQALVDYETKAVIGFEALARFESKKLGPIPPDVFIPIAEHNLFIHTLGYYVLEEALIFGGQLYKEHQRYYEMNVNVSSVQLHHDDFLSDVLELLATHDYPPEYLNLEITESVALDTDTSLHEKLRILRSHGIKISIDDFGTGYSSLNHLIALEISHLKIDRDIILRATEHKIIYQLIKGIVEFAHAMSLQVVAEGIENENMESLMGALGVDLCQGYLYSKPLIKEEVNAFLTKS